MNIFGFRPFKGKFNLGNSDDIPENQDGTLIGSIKQINTALTDKCSITSASFIEQTQSHVGVGVALTNTMTLNKGTYLIVVKFPLISGASSVGISVGNSFSDVSYMGMGTYESTTTVITVNQDNTSVFIATAASDVSFGVSLISRGIFKAIKLN